MLLDRPVVFFDNDLQEYLRDYRKMYFDYWKVTPGQKASTEEELEKALLRACSSEDAYQERYHKFRESVAEKVFDNRTEIASPRLVNDIKKTLGGF